MGAKTGIDPLTLGKAIRQGTNGRRRTVDEPGEPFLPGRHDPARFALKLANEDISLATQIGREAGVPMRLSTLTLEEMSKPPARLGETPLAFVDDPPTGTRRPLILH